jgi:hypothetical protein
LEARIGAPSVKVATLLVEAQCRQVETQTARPVEKRTGLRQITRSRQKSFAVEMTEVVLGFHLGELGVGKVIAAIVGLGLEKERAHRRKQGWR